MKRFYFFILFFVVLVPYAEATKKNVCAVTINSDDEIKLFKKHFSPQLWNFVELTSYGDQEKKDWFQKSCESKIQCDILIVSGHFGGVFMGSSQLTLSMKELEKATCSAKCDGILKKPSEVFLFGCNTLAGKEKDSRTPERYQADLIQHANFSQAQAQQVVAFRYSAFGGTFSGRMADVFSNTARIYGFNSIAPSGPNVSSSLNKYLTLAKNDYVNFDIMNSNLKADINQKLMMSLKQTAITQVVGSEYIQKKPYQKPYCYLEDSKKSRLDKIKYIRQVLESGQFLTILPYIQEFVHGLVKGQDSFTTEEKSLFSSLRHNSQILADFQKLLLLKGDVYLMVRFETYSLMRDLGIVDRSEFEKNVAALIDLDLTKGVGVVKRDALCSLDLKLNLDLSNVSEENWKDGNYFFDLLQCFGTDTPFLREKLKSIFLNKVYSGNYMGDKSRSPLLDLIQYLGVDVGLQVEKVFPENWENYYFINSLKGFKHRLDFENKMVSISLDPNADMYLRTSAFENLAKMPPLSSDNFKKIFNFILKKGDFDYYVRDAMKSLESALLTHPEVHQKIIDLAIAKGFGKDWAMTNQMLDILLILKQTGKIPLQKLTQFANSEESADLKKKFTELMK
jgi:hypothetical protein